MKLNKSKTAICLLAASVATLSVMAHAAPSFSTVSNDAVDLAFTAPSTPSLVTITKNPSLPTAGSVSDGTALFTAVNTLVGGGTARLGMTYTNGLSYQTNVTNGASTADMKATLLGRSEPKNKINIKISQFPAGNWQKPGAISYWTTNAAVASESITYILDGTQTLVADSYTASIDGAVYTP